MRSISSLRGAKRRGNPAPLTYLRRKAARWIASLTLAMTGLSSYAQEPAIVPLNTPLVADISQNTVEIHSSFNGTQLLLFGARNQPGDVVIAIRGPEANLLLRRKERIAGMWMHVEQQKYFNIPMFYGIATTRPLDEIASPSTLSDLGLGGENVIRNNNADSKELFDGALAANFARHRLWQQPFGTITYFGESLFKAKLNLPDNLPEGRFTAEIYLFDHGVPVSAQFIPLRTFKTGFDAQIFSASRNHSILFGLGAILMALGGGWLAHRLFNRRK